MDFLDNIAELILIGKSNFLGQDFGFGGKMEIQTVLSIKRMCRKFCHMLKQLVMYNKFGP
jgi:hypothetical protein